MIIDSHCHIDFDVFDPDRDDVLNRASQTGIQHIIVPGVTKNTWPRVKATCEQYAQLHPAYGLHPYFIDEHTQTDLDDLSQWIETEKPIAIGECGLDFYLKELDKHKQIEFFEAQIFLAKKYNLPLIIHSRKATEQVIHSLKKTPDVTGMIHSYSGSIEQAKLLIDLGFYISFGGAITYSKATRIRKVAEQIPLNALLIETDAPDQTGLKHHGQRNQPAYISEVAQNLAALKTLSIDNIYHCTYQNALSLFQLNA